MFKMKLNNHFLKDYRLNLSQNSDVQYLVEQINLKEPLTIKYKSKIQRVIESK